MNDPSVESSESGLAVRQQAQHRRQVQVGLVSVVFVVVTLFVVPEYLPAPWDAIAMGIASAAGLTVLVCWIPESFRSRSGSLIPALCLVAALWFLAVITTVVSLIG